MLEIRCSGTPFEIGRQHGISARKQIHGSIGFYRNLFQSTCALDWPSVCHEASKFIPGLEEKGGKYLEEIRGIAEGADVSFIDIVAINVRTEITFGLFVDNPKLTVKGDGCTAIASKTNSKPSLLSQNWDWQTAQSENLVVCHVSQPDTNIPTFYMVTEAGVIGKIGFNDRGVGVCLNALRARGVDRSRLPVHIGLRVVLESPSRQTAIEKLESYGIAGSGHILIADETGATGLECTIKGIKQLNMDSRGLIIHSNHLLLQHPDVEESSDWPDSLVRISRANELLEKQLQAGQHPDESTLLDIFKDESGYPCAINRVQEGVSDMETLFNIIMNLSEKRATVRFGRPSGNGEVVQLSL